MCILKCAAVVIKISYKRASLVHSSPLASRRAVHPCVCASEWLHILEMPLPLPFSYPWADFIVSSWEEQEALPAVQIVCEILRSGKQRPRTHPRMTHPRMSTRTQHAGMVCAAARAPWKEAASDIQKHYMMQVFPGLQHWLSPSSPLLQEELSEKHLSDFNFFLLKYPITCTLKSLYDLKAGIQRACCKLSCEDCCDCRCFLPAADHLEHTEV